MDASELKTGVWNDRTTYQCPECPYDSLEADKVLEHFQNRHRAPLVRTVLFDAAGQPFEVLGEIRTPREK